MTPIDTPTALDPGQAAVRFLGPGEGSAALLAPARAALDPEALAGLVGRVQDRCAAMLFTATPTEDLDGMGVWSRLLDQATAGLWRQIVQTSNRAGGRQRAFIGDEVALSTGLSQTRASDETETALDACALPGLVEAVEDGTWTHWHARVVVRELNQVPLLGLEQRQAVVLILLARYRGQDPQRLGKDTARLIVSIDPAAAADRQRAAGSRRHTQSWAEADQQAVFQLRGPNTDIARVIAAVRAHAAAAGQTGQTDQAGDDRTSDQRLFDAAVDLLTGGRAAGAWHVDLVVPYSLTQGGDLELADLPGLGPVLPNTARDLLNQAGSLGRICVGPGGQVLAADAPRPLPADAGPGATETTVVEQAGPGNAEPDPGVPVEAAPEQAARSAPPSGPPSGPAVAVADPILTAITRLAGTPVAAPTGVSGYAVPARLRRYLQARDRTCTFPTCHVRVTDKDHAIPWPQGPTSPANLGCLCRHHHQAKQHSFTLTRLPDGTVRWTTRGNQRHDRPPRGF